MSSATIRTAGNRRPHQYRPSDHLAGERGWRFGPLLPMDTPRPWWACLLRMMWRVRWTILWSGCAPP